MSLWISSLPVSVVGILGPISLLVVGFLVERRFISRMTIFTNSIALNLMAFGLANPPFYLVSYANIGLLLGVIALISYAAQKSMSKLFYLIGWLYCSIVVGALIFLFAL